MRCRGPGRAAASRAPPPCAVERLLQDERRGGPHASTARARWPQHPHRRARVRPLDDEDMRVCGDDLPDPVLNPVMVASTTMRRSPRKTRRCRSRRRGTAAELSAGAEVCARKISKGSRARPSGLLASPACPGRVPVLRSQVRKEDHVADGRRVRQEHGQPVDPDPPGRGRMPYSSRPQEVLVQPVSLLVPRSRSGPVPRSGAAGRWGRWLGVGLAISRRQMKSSKRSTSRGLSRFRLDRGDSSMGSP